MALIAVGVIAGASGAAAAAGIIGNVVQGVMQKKV